jgi:hypothetical protein
VAPKDTEMVADIHNHIPVPPDGIARDSNGNLIGTLTKKGQSNFSTDWDIPELNKLGLPGYLLTPEGQVKTYIPDHAKCPR